MNADELAALGCKASTSGACGCIPYGGCVAHRNRDAAYWEGEYDDCSRRYEAVTAERDTLRGEVERLTGIQRNGDWPRYLEARTRMIEAEAESERLREELNIVRSGGAVPRKPPYDRLYINWQRATEDAAMGWAENARNVERNVELFEVIRAVEAALCKEEQAVLKVAKAQQVIIDAGLATEPVGKDAPCGNRGPRIGSDVVVCVLRRGHDGDHHAHESFGPCTGWRS